MKKIIITTRKDTSAEIFRKNGWGVFLYDSINNSIFEQKNNIVYYRDPFNDVSYKPNEQKINTLMNKLNCLRSIDNIGSFKDLVSIEDKWLQAKKYEKYMPKTKLFSQINFIPGKHITKKRISQRAKDILFELNNQELDDNWIVQELLAIEEELRVYAVFGDVVPEATIKTSKQNGKVKVAGGRRLKADEIEVCESIAKISGLDFIGIDLAILKNGEVKMLEVNRSPQFSRFVEIFGEKPLEIILKI